MSDGRFFDDAETTVQNREAWLRRAAGMLEARIRSASALVEFPAYRVSVGWPSKSISKRIGECAHGATDGVAQVFVSPRLADPVEVLATLAHELIHVAMPKAGHRGGFRRTALGIGLSGPMRSTVAGSGFRAYAGTLKADTGVGIAADGSGILGELGPYPHAALILPERGKVGSRLLKAECGECGCIVRMSQSAMQDPGLPTCACGGEFEYSGDPLAPSESGRRGGKAGAGKAKRQPSDPDETRLRLADASAF
jgi:hypothetical protein